MDDDFDNEMGGLPEDELTGDSGSDSGDLGLGGMDADDEMDGETLGRPSGGARARGSSGSRPRKRAAAVPAAWKSAGGGARKMGGAKKKAGGAKKKAGSAKKKAAGKGARKSSGARKASRTPVRKASKKAAGGRKKKAGRRR
jgi:hypothetical protein